MGAKPLYHLPELLVSNEIAVCEGEKDADRPARAESWRTNSRLPQTSMGPEKWKDEYSVYLAGKQVVIFPDNDEVGKKHAEQVARSVRPYAAGLKKIS